MLKNSESKSLLAALILSVSSTDTAGMVISVGLIEIANYYDLSLSVAGQLGAVSSIFGIISALIIGAVSVRYDYKSILTLGLGLCTFSALIAVFSPNIYILIVAISLFGFAGSMVNPIADAYTGECIQSEQRSKAVGTIFALRTISYLVAVQIISLLIGITGWKRVYLFFIAPYTAISLILALKALPSVKAGSVGESLGLLTGFKMVLSNRSAVACMAANSLAMAAWGGMIQYVTSYLRENFLLSRDHASYMLSGLVLGVFIGSYVAGSLTNKYGRKNLAVASVSVVTVLLVVLLCVDDLSIVYVVVPVLSVFGGVRFTAAYSLTLDQVPSFRGTLMSLNAAALGFGWALGAAIGGVSLFVGGWNLVGYSFGLLSFLASLVYYFQTKEVSFLENKEEEYNL
jgi:predicted MFS family arabinose efflux permease